MNKHLKLCNICFLLILFQLLIIYDVIAQQSEASLYKVLTLTGKKTATRDLPQDNGVAGTWQKLLKLQTTASVLHTQAHPDDEHADLLTYLSRGKGARTALLSLNRGESGGNIVGVEFFDELGLLRTEEFLLAASYYGLDDLYFTKLVDYGFSKRVEEAYDKWGKQNVLAEMVRVIRVNRPLIIISRFHGSERDGHGNHQAAGEISQEAFTLAGNPTAFPEQITQEGLRPWQPLKLYRGGVRSTEPWNVQMNSGVYSAWLGDTYKNFSTLGYSFHRSQFGGHRRIVNGPSLQYYELLQSKVGKNEQENHFFDGIETSITGLFTLTGETAPTGVLQLLQEIGAEVNHAVKAFRADNLEVIVPYLVNGLAKTRKALQLCDNVPEAAFMLKVKEKQFQDALNTAMGIHLQAFAVPASTKEQRSFYEPEPVMGFATPAQTFKVETALVNHSGLPFVVNSVRLVAPASWKIKGMEQTSKTLNTYEKLESIFRLRVPEDAASSAPYFKRQSLTENQYVLTENANENLAWAPPVLQIAATYSINNQPIDIMVPVQVKQSNLPYGYNHYTLKVAPAIGVNLSPVRGIVPINAQNKTIDIEVELVNNVDTAMPGTLTLKTPPGCKVSPQQTSFSFTKAGEKSSFPFKLTISTVEEKLYNIQAVAVVGGKTYTNGYQVISHRDLDQSMIYRPAAILLKGVNVKVAPGLTVGYIMGVGDEVPAALKMLGATVQLLNSIDLATRQLEGFDALIIGTRAYAVRKDLHTYNKRLLNYAQNGGNLIVLFQTPEFVPDQMAPFPALLPGNSEEVSEEDSPIKLLALQHKVLNYPNKITPKDFENWVEQRGSKFFASWDTAYVPIISTHDLGQSAQSGGWLMARYGKGSYTYCAYSFHRQLPYTVDGAYRIMANLISYGKKQQ